MNPTPKGQSLDAVREIWSRRKWLGLLVFSGSLTAAISLILFLPNIYRTTATILVEQQMPEPFAKSLENGEVETRLQTIREEMLSRQRLGALIDRFGLYPHLRGRASATTITDQMRRDIGIDFKGVEQADGGRGSTIVLALSYQGTDPRMTAAVANTLAASYITENAKVREQQTSETAEFLNAQLVEMEKRQGEQERRIREFKMRHSGELPQQVDSNLSALERLNAQLSLNTERQFRSLERRETLARQIAEGVPLVPATSADSANSRLARLKQELIQLQTRYNDNYPDVIRLKQELAVLERQVAETRSEETPVSSTPADPSIRRLKDSFSRVDAEMAALKAEEGRLRRSIVSYESRVSIAPHREQEFKELSRDYDTTRELYSSLLKRSQEARIVQEAEAQEKGGNFRILDPAVSPREPVGPNRLMLALIGMMVSLGLAIAAVLVAEQVSPSFHSVDDLRSFTRVPVLVSIPPITTPADTRRDRWRLGVGSAAALMGLTLIVAASYYIAEGNEDLVRLLVRRNSS